MSVPVPDLPSPLRTRAVLVAFTWGVVALLSQFVYVSVLAPQLPTAYPLHLYTRPFGADHLWPKETIITIGWVIAVAIAAIALLSGVALLLRLQQGLFGVFLVCVAAPIAVAFQLVNSVVVIHGSPEVLPPLAILGALVLGLASFVGQKFFRSTR